MRAFFQLSIFFTFLIGFPNCSGNCPNIQPYFDIQGIQLENYKLNNNERSERLLNESKVNLKDFYIYLSLDLKFYSDKKNNHFFDIFFVSQAMALYCSNGADGTKEEIESIKIINNFDFNDSYPKGSDVTDLFQIGRDFYSNSKQFNDIKDYIRAENVKYEMGYAFFLQIKPQASNVQSFTFIYKLKNGEIYTKTSPIVEIL